MPNKWNEVVGHRGCIHPCGGEPILKDKPDGVWVHAHSLPIYLQCSECGYAPYKEQPELIQRYLDYHGLLIGYKLFTQRKDGTIGPLFINKRLRIPSGRWMPAEKNYKTKGFSYRPFWHVTSKPVAPHLKENGRVWYRVLIRDFTKMERPPSQGGLWYLADQMMVMSKVKGGIL